MKAESNIKPSNKMVIEEINGRTIVGLYDLDNIIEETRDEETIYKYNYYEIIIEDREISDEDYPRLIEAARVTEYIKLAKEIREKRDKLLADTDWTMMADVNMEVEKREKYVNYRQELRDITKQEDFPYNVTFPVLEV